MTALKEVGDRLADAARLRAASGLMLAAASLHLARLADHLAAGRMTATDALAAALVVEAAALSVPHVSPLECPHEHRRVSL
jgi:hypothetical protein